MKNKLFKTKHVCMNCGDSGLDSRYLGTGMFEVTPCKMCMFGTYIKKDFREIVSELTFKHSKMIRQCREEFEGTKLNKEQKEKYKEQFKTRQKERDNE